MRESGIKEALHESTYSDLTIASDVGLDFFDRPSKIPSFEWGHSAAKDVLAVILTVFGNSFERIEDHHVPARRLGSDADLGCSAAFKRTRLHHATFRFL